MLDTKEKSDNETYADVLTCAAKLLAWKAAQKRRSNEFDYSAILLSAAWCITLSDEYANKP